MQVSIKVDNVYLVQGAEDLEEVKVTEIIRTKDENFVGLKYLHKPLVRKMRASDFLRIVQMKTGYFKKVKFFRFFEREIFVKAKLNDIFVDT